MRPLLYLRHVPQAVLVEREHPRSARDRLCVQILTGRVRERHLGVRGTVALHGHVHRIAEVQHIALGGRPRPHRTTIEPQQPVAVGVPEEPLRVLRSQRPRWRQPAVLRVAAEHGEPGRLRRVAVVVDQGVQGFARIVHRHAAEIAQPEAAPGNGYPVDVAQPQRRFRLLPPQCEVAALDIAADAESNREPRSLAGRVDQDGDAVLEPALAGCDHLRIRAGGADIGPIGGQHERQPVFFDAEPVPAGSRRLEHPPQRGVARIVGALAALDCRVPARPLDGAACAGQDRRARPAVVAWGRSPGHARASPRLRENRSPARRDREAVGLAFVGVE